MTTYSQFEKIMPVLDALTLCILKQKEFTNKGKFPPAELFEEELNLKDDITEWCGSRIFEQLKP